MEMMQEGGTGVCRSVVMLPSRRRQAPLLKIPRRHPALYRQRSPVLYHKFGFDRVPLLPDLTYSPVASSKSTNEIDESVLAGK
jgi:hypothetical protein